MLAIPISSGSSSSNSTQSSHGPPVLTFFGPDNTSQVKAINPNGFEVARFMIDGSSKKSFNISRLTSPTTAPVPICKCESKSSLSSKSSLVIHGHEGKISFTYESSLPVLEVPSPMGAIKLETKRASSSEKCFIIKDGSKNDVAIGYMKESKLEVVVPADEMMLDCILATWIYASKGNKESAEGVSAFFEAMNAFGGVGA